MNGLLKFESNKVEIFELDGVILFNPYHVARCLELKDSAVRMAISSMNENQCRLLKNLDVNSIDIRKLNPRGENFLTESGVYKLIFKSRKPNAEKFADWVTDEVLPQIRKTGRYESQPTQLAIKPSLVRKMYQGIPVMTFEDLGILSGLSKDLAYYRVKQLEVPYRVLLSKELFAFKRENEGYGTVNAIAILYREEVLLFCRALGVDVDPVCRYFEQDDAPKLAQPKKEELNYPTQEDYRKAELMLKACEHITDKGFANYMAEGALYLLTGELYHKEYEMAKLKAELRQTLRGMNRKQLQRYQKEYLAEMAQYGFSEKIVRHVTDIIGEEMLKKMV